MTPHQRALVRRSWARLRPQAAELTALFYQRVFAVNPNARRLFGNKDMHIQGALFAQMLSMFIRSLDLADPEIVEAIKASGRRHVGYGVTYSDYDGVGEALLWAVEQALGPRFGGDVRDAWAEAYQTLAAAMRQASSTIL